VAVPGELDGAAHLAAAVDAVLADGTFAAGARRVADEIDALPPVGSAVPVLERLGGAAPA
jgi:hypothetical protein